jgi:ribosomal protein L12E/L44/L45/RPP1/RPP2
VKSTDEKRGNRNVRSEIDRAVKERSRSKAWEMRTIASASAAAAAAAAAHEADEDERQREWWRRKARREPE